MRFITILFLATLSWGCNQNKTININEELAGEWYVLSVTPNEITLPPEILEQANRAAMQTSIIFKSDNTLDFFDMYNPSGMKGTWSIDPATFVLTVYFKTEKGDRTDQYQLTRHSPTSYDMTYNMGNMGLVTMAMAKVEEKESEN
ncbi:MAG: DUF5004 domain-containing protein [Bacteroidetes bacterium]|nr:DUF5004 domain-containing protein [Bacteroidota bacterium]